MKQNLSANARSIISGPVTPAGPIRCVMALWEALVDVFKLSLQRGHSAREVIYLICITPFYVEVEVVRIVLYNQVFTKHCCLNIWNIELLF